MTSAYQQIDAAPVGIDTPTMRRFLETRARRQGWTGLVWEPPGWAEPPTQARLLGVRRAPEVAP